MVSSVNGFIVKLKSKEGKVKGKQKRDTENVEIIQIKGAGETFDSLTLF